MYVAESMLRSLALEIIRTVAPTCSGLDLHLLPGPYRWRNWRIGKLDVGYEDYGAARDKADELAGRDLWIMVPDGHPLDGYPCGSDPRPLV